MGGSNGDDLGDLERSTANGELYCSEAEFFFSHGKLEGSRIFTYTRGEAIWLCV
jgi:hypothetical protein